MVRHGTKHFFALVGLLTSLGANAGIDPNEVVDECRTMAAGVALGGEQATQFVTECVLEVVRDADEIAVGPTVGADWRIKRRLYSLRKLQERLAPTAKTAGR